MAISFASLTGGTDSVAGTSAVTASVTPSANYIVYLLWMIVDESGVPPLDPTVTGCGLTWVLVRSHVFTDSVGFNGRVGIHRAMGASPSAGAITISTGAVSNDYWAWEVIQSPDIDTGGTNGSAATVQANSSTGDSTAPATTLAAFGDGTNNGTVQVVAHGGGGTSVISPEAGFTGFTQRSASGYDLRGAWRLGGDTTPASTIAAARDWGIVALEVKAAAGGAPAFVPLKLHDRLHTYLRM